MGEFILLLLTCCMSSAYESYVMMNGSFKQIVQLCVQPHAKKQIMAFCIVVGGFTVQTHSFCAIPFLNQCQHMPWMALGGPGWCHASLCGTDHPKISSIHSTCNGQQNHYHNMSEQIHGGLCLTFATPSMPTLSIMGA